MKDFNTDKITNVINNIYDSIDIEEDMSKSIFIALLHWTIRLMVHITKLILRILIESVAKFNRK